MRSRSRDRQKIYFVTVTEKKVGIDTVQEYGKPIMRKLTVSAGTGSPTQISAGLVVDYDREITSYDKSLRSEVEEGSVCWVDVVPEIADDGSLVMSGDGVTPTVPPDYRVDKIFSTARGEVDVLGIKKIGGIGDGKIQKETSCN